jgi:1,2-diacylglycerol 3-alpha-glucosyltransferase
MNIGIFSNTYYPSINGVCVAVMALEKELIAKGHKVYIATFGVPNVEYASNVYPINSKMVNPNISSDLAVSSFYVNELTDFFKSKNIEILHTHETMMGGMELVLVARKLGIPCVHTFHTFIENYGYVPFPGYKQVIRNFTKTICSNYDAVIAPSTKVFIYLKNMKVNSEHIYNVVDLIKIEPISNFGPKNKVVVFCRLAKEKGIDKGLEIMAPLLWKYPKMSFKILGSGPDLSRLQELVKILKIEAQVEFCGFYKRQDLPNLTQDCFAFLFTSITDNLPTNLLEAASLGLPIIANTDLASEFILTDGKNGYKGENLTKNIEKIYNNPRLQKALSINSISKAKQFQEMDIVGSHIQLYQKLIDQTNDNLQKESKLLKIYEYFENNKIATQKTKLV